MVNFHWWNKAASSLKRLLDGWLSIFGRSYKATNQPAALSQETLANEVYQYEFAYTALQTQWLSVSETPTEIVFYAAVKANQATAVNEPQFALEPLKETYQALSFDSLQATAQPRKTLVNRSQG